MVASGPLTIQRLLSSMKKLDASDLHIKVGTPPVYRIGGLLKPVQGDPITEDEADHLLDALVTDAQRERFIGTGNLDFAAHLPDGDRFRINMFRAGGHTHAAIRRVKAEIPSYKDLNLPQTYHDIVERSSEGLVLIVGVTGSGKSSTLASMIEHINQTRSENIITVEDPVEYRFVPKKSIISQREIGIDVQDFPTALRYIVREDPDVIFIGELRDHDTVLSAVQAAETGHLVFSTMHTADTMQAFSRILEFFPSHEHGFLRHALANTLKAVCAQRLLPATADTAGLKAKVVPACEILLGNSTVRDKIRKGEDEDLPAIVGRNEEGMQSFTHALADLVNREWVSLSTALEFAPNRDALMSTIKGVEVKAATLTGKVRSSGH
ncbi:MAG: PilT/PilU family type 4a pilus ATPase [Phycisphaeraceae bacterium]|nr:PilT/PilU family type 4a pilus ATPase [Phycisphaerae bacterium]MBX3392002.1 PilT/PilU family type 4a pilus ATPase [Phycisphaeraceae bacterium]HRJ49385.1 PilT/PilU family type 4a pilus ATPase [Phycisphaerales bacterium]